jgi:hydroxyethylthiazole kinase-like sugar kinase family protein
MQESFFEEKFDDFRVEVIDRLARIETQHERMIERLERMNGTLGEHTAALRDHEKKLARIRGAASMLAALVAASVSVLLSRIRFWLAP